MRLLKLALRIVVEWRRSVAWAIAAVVVVSALVVLASSAAAAVHAGIRHEFRTRILGEYAGTVPGSALPELDALTALIGANLAARISGMAALETGSRFELVREATVDLERELPGLGLPASASLEPPFASGDAILLGGDGELNGSVVRLTVGATSRLAHVIATGPADARGTLVLVHDPAGLAASSSVDVRASGVARANADNRSRLVAAGLAPTRWQLEARRAAAPLSAAHTILASILALLAIVTLIPGSMLLGRRAAPYLSLMRTWGFEAQRLSRLMVLVGAVSAAIASAIGSVIGLAIAGVMNAQGILAGSVIPIELAQRLAASAGEHASEIVITPLLGSATVTVAVATLLGAATALPSALITATVDRRVLWHW